MAASPSKQAAISSCYKPEDFHMRKLVSLLGAGLLLTALAAPAEATTSPAPFSQCPPVGLDTQCGVLLTINPDGSVTVTGSNQGPFDGVEDTLIGVQNNSAVSVPMLSLAGNSSPRRLHSRATGSAPSSTAATQTPPGTRVPTLVSAITTRTTERPVTSTSSTVVSRPAGRRTSRSRAQSPPKAW